MVESVSILMPTHNRCDVLRRVLAALREIEVPAGMKVDMVIVANACTDGTVAMVREAGAGMPFPVRCVEEMAVGVSHARNRAVREAAGEILAFVDDDMFVSTGWLKGMLEVFEKHPADVVTGRTVLWWEVVPRPDWVDRRADHLLSCTDYGEEVQELTKPGLAISANMAMRRGVVEKIGLFANLGRTPTAPLSGEDTEFFGRALEAGCRLFYAPRAEGKHWVAPGRVSLTYFSKVAYSNGLVRSYLRTTLARGEAVGIVARYSFRWAAYLMLEGLAAMVGARRARANHRIRRFTCRGNITGTLRRVRGLSPTGEAIPSPS